MLITILSLLLGKNVLPLFVLVILFGIDFVQPVAQYLRRCLVPFYDVFGILGVGVNLTQLTVVSAVWEVDHSQIRIVCPGNAACRPSIVHSVGEEDARCLAQVIKTPLVDHAEGIDGDSRESFMAMILVPFVRKVARNEHAVFRITCFDNEVLATLEFPDFSSESTPGSRVVRTSDASVGAAGQFQRKIKAFWFVLRSVLDQTTQVKEVR